MVTSDTKMLREKRKDNSKIPTAKRLPPQYAKQEVLTFRLETYEICTAKSVPEIPVGMLMGHTFSGRSIGKFSGIIGILKR